VIAKTFEIRDAGTFIPMLAIRLDPVTEADRYLLARAGYGREPVQQGEFVMLCGLNGGLDRATSDPYDWTNRTRQVAHGFIVQHFDALESGAVVDVEHILGTTASPKRSEAETGS
jgi:hypothetical protein